MATEASMPSITFSGSEQVQEAASRAFHAMRARGMFMSDNAPIRVLKEQLLSYLTDSGVSAADADAALTGNPDVFGIEVNQEGQEVVVTTRRGAIPVPEAEDTDHTLPHRLMTPEPKPEKPATPVRERVSVDPSWSALEVPGGREAGLDEAEAEEIAVPLEPEIALPEIETATILEPAAEAPVVEPEAGEAPAEAPAAEPEVAAPAAAPAATDLTGVDDAEIAAALERSLEPDVHVAHFGNQWMSEDKVDRLSRGDLRRIRDYIEEQEQPLTDESLVQDILGVRSNNPDYDRILFSLNYRLSKEKDFDFVGTRDQRFWSVPTLPSIGTDRRKHNDIGTDYRFLVDEAEETVEHRTVKSIDHVVSFYEYTLGLLPYDQEMQKLMPAPVNPDQRTAILTFEIPQTYTTYLVELRYPTPNRGGFLLGFDDFYADSLVPGAVISINATDNDGHYTVEFLETDDQEDRLLELDDRRSPRYAFRPVTYTCVVEDQWLINEDRFPNLANEKPLADRARRRTEDVVAATFERIGMDDGEGGKLASFEDLLVAVNIERPFSEAMLRAALEADTNVSGDDATGYTYAQGS